MNGKVYTYRGFMIDSARHMQTAEELKKIIEAMAYLGFNTFHWHLTDDQGWRFESKRYPLLNEKAAYRDYSDFGKTFDNNRYGGVYSQETMKEVVACCAERDIDVIPEFDIPGHTSALLHAFSHLSCDGQEVAVKTHQGIFKDVLCLAKEAAFETVTGILEEMMSVFPGKYIHIGGDETPHDRWKACPACQQKMQALGITDFKEYQTQFMNRVIAFLEEHGRHAIVWNDIAGETLDKRAVIQYWKENDRSSIDFINSGGRAILSPFTYYYLDYSYEITPLNRVYAFGPMLKGLSENGKSHILGLEIPIWTEYVEDAETMQRLLFPRAVAAAYTATGRGGMTYAEFLSACTKEITALREMGVTLEDTSRWTQSRLAMPKGWLQFVKQHYTLDYIKEALK